MATTKRDPSNTAVSSIMSTSLIYVEPQESIQEAAAKLIKNNVSVLPVLDDKAALIGIFSDDDLLVEGVRLHLPTVFGIFAEFGAWPPAVKHYETQLRAAYASKVADAMETTKTASVKVNDTIETAATIMHDLKLRTLAVTDGPKVVAVVTRSDILKFLFGE
ncbi:MULTISPECIES: CBS domain-containing protein [Acidithrix]|uniref:Inosine-5'-monophosphate dehydrogenase n=1 Tax=Acidithrix ferrooxidans TaxID=1280514 RepID=A0A0D8HD34_9ACTN|nr:MULTISPECIES: CBS domain-containing protein [Acidithrix]KJF15819.1 inosine-5'-monophosphate dehydrogenase [Acidithrix ferrooxidans]CAG4905727.1 unnamed protein product [Acidithrix sp. C25]